MSRTESSGAPSSADRPQRVAVLLGGRSCERDVSLRSGQAVASALQSAGYTVARFDPILPWKDRLRAFRADCVCLCLHGTFGEDGTIQSVLEDLGLPYTGSGVTASRHAMTKPAAKALFQSNGVPTPPGCVLNGRRGPGDLPEAVRQIGFPLVVKPAAQGSSIGVTVVRRLEDFARAVAHSREFGDQVLVEKLIFGRELTVAVMDDVAWPVIELEYDSDCFDYKSKYTVGRTRFILQPDLSEDEVERIQHAARAACRSLGCRGLARVDLIFEATGTPVVLEVNTIPGMTETSLVPKAAAQAGISFVELCDRMVQLAQRPASAEKVG